MRVCISLSCMCASVSRWCLGASVSAVATLSDARTWLAKALRMLAYKIIQVFEGLEAAGAQKSESFASATGSSYSACWLLDMFKCRSIDVTM